MAIVRKRLTDNNKKLPSQWKDRFIYNMLGLFAGMLGIHNFYLRRYIPAIVQIFMSITWISAVSVTCGTREMAQLMLLIAFAVFSAEVIWITLELFLVKREPDGDAMEDGARPVRIMLIIVFWIAFIILPLLFSLMMKGTSVITDPIEERLDAQTYDPGNGK